MRAIPKRLQLSYGTMYSSASASHNTAGSIMYETLEDVKWDMANITGKVISTRLAVSSSSVDYVETIIRWDEKEGMSFSYYPGEVGCYCTSSFSIFTERLTTAITSRLGKNIGRILRITNNKVYGKTMWSVSEGTIDWYVDPTNSNFTHGSLYQIDWN